jgi:hypothetical protein
VGPQGLRSPFGDPPPDCPKLIQQVRDQVGNRFDAGRGAVLALAAEAEKLHSDKRTGECLAKVQEAAKAANLKI